MNQAQEELLTQKTRRIAEEIYLIIKHEDPNAAIHSMLAALLSYTTFMADINNVDLEELLDSVQRDFIKNKDIMILAFNKQKRKEEK